jgi:sugar porter (SP) family MFS transporter
MPETRINLRYVLGISAISALGGFLFGYDWVVIGGAKPFYERFFGIAGDPGMQGLMMSSALIGCIPGALFSGWLSDRFGRKRSLLAAAFLFTVSALGTGLSGSQGIFLMFRIIGGAGIGIASAISPMYIAEVAPARNRGGLVSLNQLNIVAGILAAQIINYLIAREVPPEATDQFIRESWNGQMGWRWMFWAETVPAALFLLLVFAIPESPRWLAKVSKWDRALGIMTRIGGEDYARERKEEIAASLQDASGKVDFRALRSARVRPILQIGIVLAVFQQWCGINVVFNYAEEVFSAAGYGVTDILFNIVITGVTNLVFTFVAIRTVDRLGRKKLMLIGAGGLSLVYLALGGSYYLHAGGLPIVSIVVLGIAVYGMSLAPVTWVVLSEIFPNRVRGAAMAVATTSLWIASSILVLTFPYLNRSLNTHGTFWLYSAICVGGFLFILFRLPETRGKTLEEIEGLLSGKTTKSP